MYIFHEPVINGCYNNSSVSVGESVFDSYCIKKVPTGETRRIRELTSPVEAGRRSYRKLSRPPNTVVFRVERANVLVDKQDTMEDE